MLVLTRKVCEQIHIGPDIVITLVSINGRRCKIGVTAPADRKILRCEVKRGIERRKRG